MYERAQILANEEISYRSNRRESTAVALRLKPMSEIQPEDYYPTFLDMLKNILDGNMDSTHYEDSLREMFGIHAYTAFTLDRVSSRGLLPGGEHAQASVSVCECDELINLCCGIRSCKMPSVNCKTVSPNEVRLTRSSSSTKSNGKMVPVATVERQTNGSPPNWPINDMQKPTVKTRIASKSIS